MCLSMFKIEYFETLVSNDIGRILKRCKYDQFVPLVALPSIHVEVLVNIEVVLTFKPKAQLVMLNKYP